MWPQLRALIQIVSISLCASVALGFVSAHPHSVTYKIVLPDDYIGWVRIDFSVKSEGDLDVSENNVATVVVQENGIAQTGSTFVSGARERYLLFYRESDKLKRVPRSLYDSSFMLGGFDATQRSVSGEPIAASWYFLIGPKLLRDQYPTKTFLQPDAKLPIPGRIGAHFAFRNGSDGTL